MLNRYSAIIIFYLFNKYNSTNERRKTHVLCTVQNFTKPKLNIQRIEETELTFKLN